MAGELLRFSWWHQFKQEWICYLLKARLVKKTRACNVNSVYFTSAN